MPEKTYAGYVYPDPGGNWAWKVSEIIHGRRESRVVATGTALSKSVAITNARARARHIAQPGEWVV